MEENRENLKLNQNKIAKMKKTLITLGVAAVAVTAWATANCPQPASAGKCGLVTEAASCANDCVSRNGNQTDIKACTGADGTKKCKVNIVNWSVSYNYYEKITNAAGGCSYCSNVAIVYSPIDSVHPPTGSGTCDDAYVSTEDCTGGA